VHRAIGLRFCHALGTAEDLLDSSDVTIADRAQVCGKFLVQGSA
jgi:hypothetical protein